MRQSMSLNNEKAKIDEAKTQSSGMAERSGSCYKIHTSKFSYCHFFSAVKQINFISPVGNFVFVDSAAAM